MTRVQLRLCNPNGRDERVLAVNVVWTREEGTCPSGESPIDWLLLTSAPVETIDDARFVIYGYTQRWKIEEFHKTWKTGRCNVEDTQLRTQQAVKVWATLLAAVAARIERLKVLSRSTPGQPASIELRRREIEVLLVLKRHEKKRTETIPTTMPTIGQATLWLAELGGYMGKGSGPPGAITIARGLDRVQAAVEYLEAKEALEADLE